MSEQSLYDRLGGVFAIAAVVDHFSDAVVQNPIVGRKSQNPTLREWHTQQTGTPAGPEVHADPLGVRRGRWPVRLRRDPAGHDRLGLEEAHRQLRITPEEFDEVAAELGRTLDAFKIPAREKDEVLGAFAAHKAEVTEGYAS